MIRQIFILVFASFIAAPPAFAGERDWKISEILGWYSRLSDATDADIKILFTGNSITSFDEGPSKWSKRRGRFEKLGRNLFVLIPEKWTDEKGTDLLAKDWCAFSKIDMTEGTYGSGARPVISIDNYISMERLQAGKRDCLGLSYFPIDPPFDRPVN